MVEFAKNMDVFTKAKRSEVMSKVRSKNTKPELEVRKALTLSGFRYRLNVARLPGKPDIVIPKIRTILFINGCFWHRHRNCKRSTIPASNSRFWEAKLRRNVILQSNAMRALRKLGWKVHKVWECEITNEEKLGRKLANILRGEQDNRR